MSHSPKAFAIANVTNESKATMFSSPTFTGTVNGVTAAHVGLGNVTNESKATMFASPTFTGTVSGVTASHVGLGTSANPQFNSLNVGGAYGTTAGVAYLGGANTYISGNNTTVFVAGSTINFYSSGITQASVNYNGLQAVSFGVGTAPSGTTGEIRATNNITGYYTSDRNLKENIRNITGALDKVRELNGVMFDWKQSYIEERGGEDGYFVRKQDTGVIAQEVEAVLPEVVGTRENGTKAVAYEKLAGLLIEAIKELDIKIEDIKRHLGI
jgi:hypothetical protein